MGMCMNNNNITIQTTTVNILENDITPLNKKQNYLGFNYTNGYYSTNSNIYNLSEITTVSFGSLSQTNSLILNYDNTILDKRDNVITPGKNCPIFSRLKMRNKKTANMSIHCRN